MIYFFFTVLILGAGHLLHSKVKILNKYRIPVSLSTSLIILAIITFTPSLKEVQIYHFWKSLPTNFIALVFACLFLESSEKRETSNMQEVLGQTSYVWIAILGQSVIAIILTLILFTPVFSLPIVFASILEAGFAGGHGTAFAMSEILIKYGLPQGLEYGLFSATIGLLLGIFGGIWLINTDKSRNKKELVEEDYSDVKLSPSKFITSISLIFSAFLFGYLVKESAEDFLTTSSFLPIAAKNIRLPLFVYTLLSSIFIKYLLILTNHVELIDNKIIAFFSDFFMEVLVFAGIATIDLQIISDAILPLLLLFAAGFAWNLFCHFVIRPRLIDTDYSFEISILNFGMLNGTTGIGLMLLKMVDPEFKTRAAKIYAESAPFTSPFIGGGLITLSLPFLLNNQSPLKILAILITLMVIFYFAPFLLRRKK